MEGALLHVALLLRLVAHRRPSLVVLVPPPSLHNSLRVPVCVGGGDEEGMGQGGVKRSSHIEG